MSIECSACWQKCHIMKSVAHVRNPPFRSSKYMCHFTIAPQELSTGNWKKFISFLHYPFINPKNG